MVISNENEMSGVAVWKDSHSSFDPSFVSWMETAAFWPSRIGALPTPTTCLVSSLFWLLNEVTSANLPDE